MHINKTEIYAYEISAVPYERDSIVDFQAQHATTFLVTFATRTLRKINPTTASTAATVSVLMAKILIYISFINAVSI